MRASRALAVVLALVVVGAPALASAFHFYLEPGAGRCFVEQLPKDTLVVGACGALSVAQASSRRGLTRTHPHASTRLSTHRQLPLARFE